MQVFSNKMTTRTCRGSNILPLSQGIFPKAFVVLAVEYIFDVHACMNTVSRAGMQSARVGYLSRELVEVGLQVMV